jgi:hypothetical protein
MANPATAFDQYVQEEVNKYKGVLVPVKAGIPRRLLLKHLPCSVLHPNPADEFCIPSVGPSGRIISEYVKLYQKRMKHGLVPIEEPLIVERVYPHGYLLLNGHHRWAAAIRIGIGTVPVKIVNLTQDTDIEKVIKNSKHNKRVTFDLDEVILRGDEDEATENAPGILFPRLYKERIKKGVPALFHFLAQNGYDIWLYSADYYSFDYIRHLFKRYHAHVDAIVTGAGKKLGDPEEAKKKMDRIKGLIDANYKETITIDNNMVVRSRKGSKEFDQFDVSGEDETWSAEVLDIAGQIVKGDTHE